MGFQIKHSILFELNIWHHYFLNKGGVSFVDPRKMTDEERIRLLSRYNVHRFFEIKPTSSCKETLKNHQLILKNTPTGILVGTKTEQGNGGKIRPWIPPQEQDKFTFILTVKDPKFYNYTDLPLSVEKHKIYYFNNWIDQPDFLIDLTTEPSPGNNFVNASHELQVLQPLHNIEISGQATASVFQNTRVAQTPVLEKTFSSEEAKAPKVQLDMRQLPSGWYRLHLTNPETDKSFFLNNEGLKADTFGVVEIYCRNASDDQAFLDENGNLKKTDQPTNEGKLPGVFELRFKNRWTKWRYLNSKNEEQLTTGYNPLTASGNVPIELGGKLAPNPSAKMIKKEDGDIFSEIYI
jgi:acyl-CoA-binding protein